MEYSMQVLRKAVKTIPEHLKSAARTERAQAVTKFMETNPGMNKKAAIKAVNEGAFIIPNNVNLARAVSDVNKTVAVENYMKAVDSSAASIKEGVFFG